MEALFGPTLLSRSGPLTLQEGTQPDIILLYFSASWCGPCRSFTPRLQMFYETVNDMAKQVEVIFISRDKSQEQFDDYYADMPWLAMPYSEVGRVDELRQRYGVTSIPKLVLIKKDGTMALDTCRADVEQKGPLALAGWNRALRN